MSMPESLRDLAISIAAEHCNHPNYDPQIALINIYEGKQVLNMHKDLDEMINAPIISLSFNASGIFAFDKDGKREQVQLDDRDVFIFSGDDRYITHGYLGNINPNEIRMNITIRQYE
jgi:alkylated DNA repair dioxygenase AlkB